MRSRNYHYQSSLSITEPTQSSESIEQGTQKNFGLPPMQTKKNRHKRVIALSLTNYSLGSSRFESNEIRTTRTNYMREFSRKFSKFVTFKNDLVKVIEVESYKQYNSFYIPNKSKETLEEIKKTKKQKKNKCNNSVSIEDSCCDMPGNIKQPPLKEVSLCSCLVF